MRPLSAVELLGAWERGAALQPVERPLELLRAAFPGSRREELAEWSVGRRDTALLGLREATLGRDLACVARCPGCGETVEMRFDTARIRSAEGESGEPGPIRVAADGWELELRLPSGRDLAELAGAGGTVESARRRLVERCLLAARHAGRERQPADVPESLFNAIEKRLARADPQADVRLALACPSCGHRWRAPFDVASFFWEEVDAAARRLLAEVDALARAYGWREADILALPPARRRRYLEMLG